MKRFLVIGVPIALLSAALIWRYGVDKATASQLTKSTGARKSAAANAVLAKARPRDILQKMEIVGSAESPFDVKISPKATGIVEFLNLREGDPVKAGQVVARVDSEEIDGQVVQAQATLAAAQQRLAQAQLTTNSTNVGVYSQITQQRANVASQQAEYNQTDQNYAAQVASAESAVTDADAKVAAARSQVASAQAQVESAQANLEDAQAKYNRTYTLYKQAYVAAQDVDDARTAYKVQIGALNVSKKSLDAARSALQSAQAQRDSAANQASITKLKGRADVQAAKALVTQAKASLRNANANLTQIPAYQQNIQALKSEVEAAKAGLVQAQARLANTTLTSPIDGTVTSRTADPGSVASPGTPILTVQYLKWLYATGPVPVEDTSIVHTGMPVLVTFDSYPDKPFSGSITRINPSADPTNRQFGIYVRLDNASGMLRPGMYCKIDMITNRTHAEVVVPREAVRPGPDGAGNLVTVVDQDNVAHVVPVKIGVEDDAGIQILDGVAPGDRVVVQTYTAIKDGQKVNVGKQGSGAQTGANGAHR